MLGEIIYSKTVPKREADYASFPENLGPQLKEYLNKMEIQKLYSHQAEMFELVSEGRNVVITTTTASGKTLSFLLPVVQQILKNPLTRAIFVYPTKALANDQYRAMLPLVEYFGKNKISIGVYHGDTPSNERSRIRNSANIILTNPEMLNSTFLPNHSKFGFDFVFSNLKFVVIDELHSYRGAFGSHLANIFRRLHRICKYYNSYPQFLCSSATIANPIELAENICGEKFEIIDKDGSPTPSKKYNFIQPPTIDKTDFKMPGTTVASDLLPKLVMNGRSIITFCKSRKNVELVLKQSRDKLKYDGVKGQDMSNLISGYRGGYKPRERKEIENRMVRGNLRALVSTNALELGIDIGNVDTIVLVGYPYTKSSFWQQSGRAGRAGKNAETFLILEALPFDQYIAIDPEWLFKGNSENAVIDKDNIYIQLVHLRSAAAELPLSLDDKIIFPDLGEIIPVLIKAGELRSAGGKFIWCGSDYPAGDYSLRNMDKERYKLVDQDNGITITEADELQAFKEFYKGAIYMHDGRTYIVIELDIKTKTAIVKATNDNYYTNAIAPVAVTVIKEHKQCQLGRTICKFGDVRVSTEVQGYKKLQFHNHQNLGYEELEEPLKKEFETEGVWIDIPNNVCKIFRVYLKNPALPNDEITYGTNYFKGMAYAIYISTLMTTMTSGSDIDYALISRYEDGEVNVAICIYDMFVGGLGYSEKAFGVIETVMENAIKRVEGCRCMTGCPVCTGDYLLDKKIVLWGLKNLYKELEKPEGVKIPDAPPRFIIEKPYKLDEMPEKWDEFKKFLQKKGEYLSDYISTVDKVEISENKLILLVETDFYKKWIDEKDNKLNIKNMISTYVKVPKDFNIGTKVISNESIEIKKKVIKRFKDLRK